MSLFYFLLLYIILVYAIRFWLNTRQNFIYSSVIGYLYTRLNCLDDKMKVKSGWLIYEERKQERDCFNTYLCLPESLNYKIINKKQLSTAKILKIAKLNLLRIFEDSNFFSQPTLINIFSKIMVILWFRNLTLFVFLSAEAKLKQIKKNPSGKSCIYKLIRRRRLKSVNLKINRKIKVEEEVRFALFFFVVYFLTVIDERHMKKERRFLELQFATNFC